MTRVIEPTKGRVLVKLNVSEYGNIPVPEKTFDSVSNGEILKVHPDDKLEGWIGKTGYWKQYKDDLRIATLPTGEKLALIPIIDIDGTSYDKSD